MAYLSDLVRISLETKPEIDPSKVKTALLIKTTPYNNKYHSEVVIYGWLFGEVIHSFWTLTLSVGLCRIVWASCYMSSSGSVALWLYHHTPAPTSLSHCPPVYPRGHHWAQVSKHCWHCTSFGIGMMSELLSVDHSGIASLQLQPYTRLLLVAYLICTVRL